MDTQLPLVGVIGFIVCNVLIVLFFVGLRRSGVPRKVPVPVSRKMQWGVFFSIFAAIMAWKLIESELRPWSVRPPREPEAEPALSPRDAKRLEWKRLSDGAIFHKELELNGGSLELHRG
jgi:hypothetical protein